MSKVAALAIGRYGMTHASRLVAHPSAFSERSVLAMKEHV